MITPQRIKQLLNDPDMDDLEAERIRDDLRSLAEVIFEQWQSEVTKAKENKYKDYDESIKG